MSEPVTKSRASGDQGTHIRTLVQGSTMTLKPNVSGHLVAKNSALSFIQMLVPILLAFATIPYVIHKLGLERFGVLSLVSIFVGGYANLFDLGMGRATTYFVAGSLGRGEHDRVPRVAFSSLCIQVAAGFVAAGVLAVLTPIVTTRLLHVSVPFQGEARTTFWLASASLPLLAIFRNLRAVLEAYQRFDLISAVQIPSSSVNLLLPALGAWAGLHLPGIMLLLIASRVMTIAAYVMVSERAVPTFWGRIGFEKGLLPLLFSYGGWAALSDALIPVINYSDRFVIGSVLSVGALGYYAAPFEAVSKALIVPSAIVQSLFPALGTLGVARREQFAKLYANALKYTLLVMTPLILAVVLFARNILTLWIGKDFAGKSTLVLQLLAVGMLLNAVSQVACTLLDAMGKPDLRAKVFLAVVAPFLILLVVLTKLFGLNGAAAGWLLGTALHTAWYLLLSRKVLPETIAGCRDDGVRVAALLTAGCMAAAGVILLAFGGSPVVKSLASMLLLAFFLAVAWRFAFDGTIKRQLVAVLRGN